MLAVMALTLAVLSGGTQVPPRTQDGPFDTLQKVIPNPTGKNGYEEFVVASAMIRYSTEITDAVEQNRVTLKEKRQGVAMNRKALELFRAGLKKPILPPREKVGFDTVFPELGHFRDLARLLRWEQEVYLADGRVSQAISSWRDGMMFSRRIQMTVLIAGLVGVACENINMVAVPHHLEQLSYSDCRQLQQAVTELLALPDPLPALLNAEFQTMDQMLSDLAKKRNLKLDDLVGELDEQQPGAPDPLEVFRRDPGFLIQSIPKVREILQRRHAELLSDARKPAWERTPPEDDTSQNSDPVERLAAVFSPSLARVTDRYTVTQVRLRLLGTHAAVLSYRWWNDHPPASLEMLKLGDMAVDPFSGKPFKYVPSEFSYQLHSVGGGQRGPQGDLFVTPEGTH